MMTGAAFVQANNLNYGLYFKSYSNLGKDRTSLILNNNEALKIKDETSLSFDLYIRKELIFGNIIHIINNFGEKIALNFSVDEKNNRYPSLIIDENFYPVSNKIEFEKWFPVNLKFSSGRDTLYLSYGDINKSYPLNSNRWKNMTVYFGACTFHGFETSEVAAVNIKDIKIYEKENLIRHWALKEHSDNICYDLVNNIPAIAQNPEWLIDNHTTLEKIYSREFKNNNNPQYAYDTHRDILYIVPDEKTIIAYNPVSNKDSIILVKGGYPASASTNGLMYNYLNDELISYSLDDETISRFSFKSRKWSKTTPCEKETRFWHHTASINNTDSSIVAFGGYGYYQYKNDIFTVKLNGDVWERNKLLTIMPRYSPASVIVNNKLYIFGGRGSETGKQEVNSRFNFDLYAVDLKTKETKLLWETQETRHYLPCGNMIYDPSDSCFYVLTNIENGTLMRMNAHTSRIEKVSNGINESMAADFLFYTLFFSPRYQKIYALFCCNYKQGTSNISFYEIAFPPLSQSEISQDRPVHKKSFSFVAVIGISLLSLAAIVFLFFTLRKRKKGSLDIAKAEKNIVAGEKETVIAAHEKILDAGERKYGRSKQCISLLGGFNAIDKTGANVTISFTPILKNLLLLILLYSETEEKGINDKKIDNLLWADKDSKAARNNRNVSLTRLKLLLENIGDVTLLNNNGFWKISFGENIFCDYHASLSLIKKFKTNSIDKTGILELMELLMCGQLLPYTQADWLDKFKSAYSNDAIDILYNLLLSEDVVKDEELGLQITDAIFLFDSLNEEALRIKCSILYNSGKKGLAKSAYDIFSKEYKMMLGENYKYSLSQVLEAAKNIF